MDSMKRIVHLISSTSFDRGGPSLSCTQLMESHRRAGLEGSLVCPDYRAEPHRYAQVTAAVHSSVQDLLANVPRDSIRAFHLHGIWDLFLHRAAKVAKECGIPCVYSPRGMLEPWALNQKKWKKRIAWWLYQRDDLKRAAFLHATAQSEASQLIRLGLLNPVAVIPNGVNLPNLPEHRSADRTALFLSRIHPKKGLLLLAEAWAKVRPAGWKMLVVGPDEEGYREQVRKRVAELRLSDSWEFRDAVYGAHKDLVFQQASLFVLPTFSENFGIAVAEALSYGLPVITTNQAPWEGLISNRCGWWVDADEPGIALALAEATAIQPKELLRMGERGRNWVQDQFAWPSIANRLINAYDQYLPSH